MNKLWIAIRNFFGGSRVQYLKDRSDNIVNVFKRTADELQEVNKEIDATQLEYENELARIQASINQLQHQYKLNAIVAEKIKNFLSDDEE